MQRKYESQLVACNCSTCEGAEVPLYTKRKHGKRLRANVESESEDEDKPSFARAPPLGSKKRPRLEIRQGAALKPAGETIPAHSESTAPVTLREPSPKVSIIQTTSHRTYALTFIFSQASLIPVVLPGLTSTHMSHSAPSPPISAPSLNSSRITSGSGGNVRGTFTSRPQLRIEEDTVEGGVDNRRGTGIQFFLCAAKFDPSGERRRSSMGVRPDVLLLERDEFLVLLVRQVYTRSRGRLGCTRRHLRTG